MARRDSLALAREALRILTERAITARAGAVVETPKTFEDRLDEQEAALRRVGFPALSPWWQATLRRFAASGKRELVVRAGRRGGKSTSLCRLLVLSLLFGGHVIPPGDVGIAAVISVDRTEASRRIRTIAAVLDALGVGYETRNGALWLRGLPFVVQPFTASIAGVSGGTVVFALCDEVSKWRDADTGANPATEVLASLRPATATQPQAKVILSSSPLGNQDAHAKAFDEGDTPRQMVCHAATWEANPTITEADTHALEPDVDVWRREYAAIPLEGAVESIYAPSVLDDCTRAERDVPPQPGWSYIAAIDPATRGNAWSLSIGTVDGAGRRIVAKAKEWRGSPAKPLVPSEVFTEMAEELAPYRVKHVWTDPWAFDALADHARQARRRDGTAYPITLLMVALTPAAKLKMHDGIARDMAERRVELPKDPAVRADLLSVRRVITPTGIRLVLTDSPDGRHADYAPSVALVLTQPCDAPRALLADVDRIEAEALAADEAMFGRREAQAYWDMDPLSRRRNVPSRHGRRRGG